MTSKGPSNTLQVNNFGALHGFNYIYLESTGVEDLGSLRETVLPLLESLAILKDLLQASDKIRPQV